MKRTYQRVQILNYWELTDEQKESAKDQCDERAEESQYVIWTAPNHPKIKEVLPMEMFTRYDYGYSGPPVNPSLFDAHYGQSYFSAYMIKINRTGEEATLAYCHW